MSQTQSIIVYRNPAEAAFWESGMLIPLIGGLGVGVITFLLVNALCGVLCSAITKNAWRAQWPGYVAAASAFAAGLYTLNAMII